MTSPHLETALTPVTLLTGFLGSGKTTVLNQLVRQPTLARTLVIINEFGEIGLDHLLMSRVADDNMIEMSSGCLCCTIRGDLVETLRDAHWRYQVGGEPRFDRVVIETTGVADPAPIIHTLMSVGAIARRYRLDGVVATIDLTSAEATLDAQPEAVKQAAMADCLLLTKRDLVDAEQAAALEQRLQRINPAARRLEARHGQVAAADILGLGLFSTNAKIPDVARWLNEEAYAQAHDPHASHSHHGHAHDVNRHDDHIQSFAILVDEPIPDAMLDAWLDLLLAMCGQDMLRIKGILNVRGRTQPIAIHGVQHLFYPPIELPGWTSEDQRSKLVFITRDVPRTVIEETLEAFLATWPD
ncbi:CobW family GTP-binding protein [Halochromatium salexigens]|uniref:GTP-binding protein n=1 Tax=Halochromatium salexigens TaxID=49447 RepID=A0AAJ0XFI9_HALSE|nr:GTP-binding protein [Halochromatium salexigens]MBK5930433.1 GTP-binding protein [Halochromatium salexigens]